MHQYGPTIVQVLIVVAIALIIWFCNDRFSPDPLLTKIVQVLVFVGVLAFLASKLLGV